MDGMRSEILENSFYIRDEVDIFWIYLLAFWSLKHLKWIRKQIVYGILSLAIYQILLNFGPQRKNEII